MDRRNFLRAAFAVAGAATVGAMAGKAEAATLLDDLASGADLQAGVDLQAGADLPATGAAEAQLYERRGYDYDRPRGYGFRGGDIDDWRGRRRWRRRPRCWVSRNRWGEMVRRCERF
ncbi:MAG: hypothetical protein JWN93_224 [Hyphomicrobiales bacterium]|nr:hypothetical protein [Hyphomicrobiales bacterium]